MRMSIRLMSLWLVLRGVFTATRDEIDHIFHGGAAPFFPGVYRDFLNVLPTRGPGRYLRFFFTC